MITKKDIQVFRERQRILLHTKEFICLRPHFGLSDYISNYNITFPSKAIMPDGFTSIPCACASLSIEIDSKRISVNLEGPATKPIIIRSQVNQLDMLVTIEFKPAGLYAIIGINQSEIADKTISFEDVDKALCKTLSEIVEKSGSVYELVASLDILMLENATVVHSPQLMMTLHNIIGSYGSMAIKSLSDDAYYSERQMNRIFKQHVGVSAKSFSRIVRINKSFHLLHKPATGVAMISDLLGFHDLSHFVRDFRSVSGMTPQEYRNNKADFYINTTKY